MQTVIKKASKKKNVVTKKPTKKKIEKGTWPAIERSLKFAEKHNLQIDYL